MIFFCICFFTRALLLFSFARTLTFTCTACNFTLEHFHCTAFTLHTLCIFFLTIDSFFFVTIAAPSRRGRRWKQHKITTDFLQGKQTGRLVCTLFFRTCSHKHTLKQDQTDGFSVLEARIDSFASAFLPIPSLVLSFVSMFFVYRRLLSVLSF